MLDKTHRLTLPALILVTGTLAAQTSHFTESLPPPDPGYRLYFHNDEGELEQPLRWGYHDGWMQGRADRTGGQDRDPHLDAAYTRGRLHGTSGTLPEEQYLRVYRSAYLRGYEHGYRI